MKSGPKKRTVHTSPRVTIKVMEPVIAHATRRDSGHCMIADSIKATVPGAENVLVDLQTIRWSDREAGKRYVYLTPRVAQMALLDFDIGKEIVPFQFQLRYAQVVKCRAKDVQSEVPTKATLHQEEKKRVRAIKVGGQSPPIGPLSNSHRVGKRRQYGLRMLSS